MFPGTLDPRITFARASTATYTDSTGTIQTAATNAPRWDYDPVTHALRGVLIEEQRTNSTFPSVPVLSVQWQVSASIGISGAFAAPDGTSTASLFSATSTVSEARAMANVAGALAPSGTPTTVSVFLKKSPNNAYIQVNSSGTVVVPVAYYDLTNGTAVVGADLLGSITGKSVSITPYPNGWYRCTFTFTLPAGSSGAALYIGPCVTVSATGDNRAYPGVVGQGVYAWGAQVEQGSFPTSYIGTTSAAVTRAQDSCAIPPANMSPWFASPGGSWFAEFVDLTNAVSVLSGTTRVIGEPVASNGHTPITDTGSGIGTFDGIAFFQTANVAIAGGVNKGAATWAPGRASICLNGGAVASAATQTQGFATFSTTGVRFLIVAASSVDNMTGYIRRVSYWPRALSDTEMQQVTT